MGDMLIQLLRLQRCQPNEAPRLKSPKEFNKKLLMQKKSIHKPLINDT
jgi:hypothetical protein